MRFFVRFKKLKNNCTLFKSVECTLSPMGLGFWDQSGLREPPVAAKDRAQNSKQFRCRSFGFGARMRRRRALQLVITLIREIRLFLKGNSVGFSSRNTPMGLGLCEQRLKKEPSVASKDRAKNCKDMCCRSFGIGARMRRRRALQGTN